MSYSGSTPLCHRLPVYAPGLWRVGHRSAVVVVSRQMPWDGLSWGRWTPEDPGREGALKSAHGRTRALTQVRGSPIEIKPLLLPLECISVWSQELQWLLELYEAGGK